MKNIYQLALQCYFNEIGWLCDTKKAGKLGNSVVLDALEEKLTGFYGLHHKGGIWSRERQNFVDYLSSCPIKEMCKRNRYENSDT